MLDREGETDSPMLKGESTESGEEEAASAQEKGRRRGRAGNAATVVD
jgi:hypothetical protein